jgi:23S rRNA G2069 N7-methylase RlmK/C1962 C5-methylase RlmI
MDRHRFLREDIMPWLKKPNLLKYDFIVVTPPTFSNSKSMREPFDLKQDYPKLINYCLPKLNEGGKLYFLTNARKFKLDETLISGATEIKEVTKQTLPADHRKRNLHRCWRMS